MDKVKSERNKQICDLYRQNVTVKEMAERFGISKQRVSIIISVGIPEWERDIIKEDRRIDKRHLRLKDRVKELREEHGISYETYLSQVRAHRAGKRWSILHDKCKHCGRTDTNHHTHGYCNNCGWYYVKTDPGQKAKRLACSKRWVDRNKEQKAAYQKKYYGENREIILKRSHDSYIENQKDDPVFQEYNRKRSREYYHSKRKNNPKVVEEGKKKSKEYYHKNKIK